MNAKKPWALADATTVLLIVIMVVIGAIKVRSCTRFDQLEADIDQYVKYAPVTNGVIQLDSNTCVVAKNRYEHYLVWRSEKTNSTVFILTYMREFGISHWLNRKTYNRPGVTIAETVENNSLCDASESFRMDGDIHHILNGKARKATAQLRALLKESHERVNAKYEADMAAERAKYEAESAQRHADREKAEKEVALKLPEQNARVRQDLLGITSQ